MGMDDASVVVSLGMRPLGSRPLGEALVRADACGRDIQAAYSFHRLGLST